MWRSTIDDAGLLRAGQTASVKLNSYPDAHISRPSSARQPESGERARSAGLLFARRDSQCRRAVARWHGRTRQSESRHISGGLCVAARPEHLDSCRRCGIGWVGEHELAENVQSALRRYDRRIRARVLAAATTGRSRLRRRMRLPRLPLLPAHPWPAPLPAASPVRPTFRVHRSLSPARSSSSINSI